MSEIPQPPPFPVIDTRPRSKTKGRSRQGGNAQFLDYAAMFSAMIGIPLLLMPCFWVLAIPLFLGGLVIALSAAFSAKGGVNAIQLIALALNGGALLLMAVAWAWFVISASA